MLSKPSNATPVPAFSVSCEKENRSRNVQEPIPDSNRHGDRNPRVFLLAKVIYQASSQLNPDKCEYFSSTDIQYHILNFFQAQLALHSLSKFVAMPQMRSYGKEAPIHRWRLSIDLSMMIIRFQRWEQLLVIKTTDEEVWQVPKRVWLAKDKLYFSYHISFSIIIPWIINLIMAPILASHLERFRKHPQSWINLERTKVVAASFCR